MRRPSSVLRRLRPITGILVILLKRMRDLWCWFPSLFDSDTLNDIHLFKTFCCSGPACRWLVEGSFQQFCWCSSKTIQESRKWYRISVMFLLILPPSYYSLPLCTDLPVPGLFHGSLEHNHGHSLLVEVAQLHYIVLFAIIIKHGALQDCWVLMMQCNHRLGPSIPFCLSFHHMT